MIALPAARAQMLDPASPAETDGLHHISAAPLKQTRNVKITAVIDPLTLQTDKGEIIRLSGIECPDYTLDNPGAYSLLTRDILTDFLIGQTVTLYQTPDKKTGRTDRMGHSLAHIERTADGTWVQGLLLKLGLARVRTRASTPELADQMYALEHNARQEKAGLWAEEKFAVRSPTSLDNSIDTVQIVAGRVYGTANKNGRIYINFGPDWRTDFTITIEPEDKKRFYQANIDPLSWTGKLIEVRGWVDDYNGPTIRLTHPQAVQLQTGQ